MSGGSPAGSASGAGGPPAPESMVTSQAANGAAGGSNLLTDFEEAYEEAMGTLTKEDNVFDRSPETMQQVRFDRIFFRVRDSFLSAIFQDEPT